MEPPEVPLLYGHSSDCVIQGEKLNKNPRSLVDSPISAPPYTLRNRPDAVRPYQSGIRTARGWQPFVLINSRLTLHALKRVATEPVVGSPSYWRSRIRCSCIDVPSAALWVAPSSLYPLKASISIDSSRQHCMAAAGGLRSIGSFSTPL